jgi:hypothetical protein
MATNTAATAVAPQINGKDVAVHTIKSIGTGLYIGISAVGSLVKYGTAHAVHLADKTQTVIGTAEEIEARKEIFLEKYHNALSGFKPEIVK